MTKIHFNCDIPYTTAVRYTKLDVSLNVQKEEMSQPSTTIKSVIYFPLQPITTVFPIANKIPQLRPLSFTAYRDIDEGR